MWFQLANDRFTNLRSDGRKKAVQRFFELRLASH
jgi:hypothetical protein